MKAQELRIGNYFYPINRDVPSNIPHMPIEIPFMIAYFGEFDEVVACQPHEKICTIEKPNRYKFNDMSPIQLTKEWALDLGLNYNRKTDMYELETKETALTEISFGKEFKISAFFEFTFIRHIKYVHELQNLVFELNRCELKRSKTSKSATF